LVKFSDYKAVATVGKQFIKYIKQQPQADIVSTQTVMDWW